MGLFKPAWMNETESKALKAVSKITNQTKLAYIVKDASLSSVRLAALDKLADQRMLADIAILGARRDRNYRDKSSVCRVAFDKLTDQKMLADIAIHGARGDSIYEDICVDAAKRLTDQNLLAVVAKAAGSCPWYVRDIAVCKLTDQTILLDIAQNDVESQVCLVAADCLTDENLAQAAYIKIALHSSRSNSSRNEAAQKVKDKSIFEEICAKGFHYGEEIRRYTEQNGDKHYPFTVYRCIICGKEYEVEGEMWW